MSGCFTRDKLGAQLKKSCAPNLSLVVFLGGQSVCSNNKGCILLTILSALLSLVATVRGRGRRGLRPSVRGEIGMILAGWP